MASTATIRITRVVAPGELARQIEPKMRNLGNAIGRRMQRLVPKRSWTLHDSIGTETERTAGLITTTVSAGSEEAFYWDMVERGTSKQAAQPYMRPALLQSRQADLNYTGDLAAKHGTVAVARLKGKK